MTRRHLMVANACESAWGRHLDPREHKIAVFLAIRTWCRDQESAEVELAELARAGDLPEHEAIAALDILHRKGALSRLAYVREGTAVMVTLTPRWTGPEDAP